MSAIYQKKVIPYQELDPKIQSLVDTAHDYAARAYCPYSRFPVGAAVMAANADGEEKQFGGFNVENASYGGSVCAERTAIFSAVLEGYKNLKSVAVVCAESPGSSPCGFCRQVMREFGKNATIYVVADTARGVTEWTMDELLPNSFGPEDL